MSAIDYDESLVREAAAQSGDSARLDIENARQVAPPTRPAPARSATPYLSDAIAKMSVRPAHVNNADAGDRVTADGGMRGNPYPGQAPANPPIARSEERREGKECVSTGRIRGSP